MADAPAPKKAAAKKAPASAAVAPAHATGKLAVVLIRGLIGTRHDVRKTLYDLRLRRKMVCVVLADTPAHRGMLHLCKDFTTYGPITDETLAALKAKRRALNDADGKPMEVFPMNPPRGGFGHKGTKVGYQDGGCLGYRAKGMDAFLARMM